MALGAYIQLTWNHVAVRDGYRILRSTDGGVTYDKYFDTTSDNIVDGYDADSFSAGNTVTPEGSSGLAIDTDLQVEGIAALETIHSPLVLADHIGEHTPGHSTVFDSDVTLADGKMIFQTGGQVYFNSDGGFITMGAGTASGSQLFAGVGGSASGAAFQFFGNTHSTTSARGSAYLDAGAGSGGYYGHVNIRLNAGNRDIAVFTYNGSIGSAYIAYNSTDKLSFFGATAVAIQGATTDLGTVLSNYGLRTAGTAYPITTSGTITFTGTVANGGTVTTIDINGGSIDGTVIGANSAAYGTFSAVTITSADYGLNLLDSGSAYYLKIVSDSTPLLTANRVLTFDVTNVARTITLSGNPTLGDWFDQSVKQAANPTFGNLTITSFAANWTNAGRTVADIGTVTTGIYTTVNATTIHTTTLLVDHIGEHVGSHTVTFDNDITLSTKNIITDTTTGTKIGTATNQKFAFYNSTPIIQPIATTDLGTVLSNLGLRAAGTAYPITTSGAVLFTGGLTITTADLTITDRNIILGTTTGTKLGSAADQKLGLWGITPKVQPVYINHAAGTLAQATTAINALLTAMESIGVLAGPA